MALDVAFYVDAWRDAADEMLALGRTITPDELTRPTDLPGWNVFDIYAHLAAIEAHLAGEPDPPTEIPDGLPHVRDQFGAYTEAGVRLRRGRPFADVLDEFSRHVATRTLALRESPPADLGARATVTPAGQAWTWEVLLRNRVVDVWMHQQDVRRAIGRAGGLDGPGAGVTIGTFRAALPFVLGKRVAPPVGTTVVWEVRGRLGFKDAVRLGEDGRAVVLTESPAEATAEISMDTGTFVILAGGRRNSATVNVTIRGDRQLADAALQAMNVTP